MQEWHPHPGPQTEVLLRDEFEILFGGSRGPGKTDAGLTWLLGDEIEPGKLYVHHPRYRALVIRKNADDLADWVDRAGRMYYLLGAKIAYRPAEITFPSGAKIRTGHLKDEQSYMKYMGQEFPRMLNEELTQIPSEKRYLQLLGSCRSIVPELKPQVFNTTNPGGPGHAWVKRRFVDVAPPGTTYVDPNTGRTRVFIPATLEDNPTLMQNDPDYINYLEGLKASDYELWKAWRLGDWNTFAGQFFREFRRDLHVVKPFTPGSGVTRVGGIDWGYNASFVFGASAIQNVKLTDGTTFNRVWTYKVIDGTEKTPEVWAKEIMEKVNLDQFAWIKADPAMFHRSPDGSLAIADRFKNVWGKNGYKLQPANNDRIGGWAIMHNWLSLAPDGLPYWLITEDCHNLITTLPELVHDENKVEDLDTNTEDHWADALRYCLVHVKYIKAKVGAVNGINPGNKYKQVLPTNEAGDLLSVDTDLFATAANKKSKSWNNV